MAKIKSSQYRPIQRVKTPASEVSKLWRKQPNSESKKVEPDLIPSSSRGEIFHSKRVLKREGMTPRVGQLLWMQD